MFWVVGDGTKRKTKKTMTIDEKNEETMTKNDKQNKKEEKEKNS